LAVPSINEYQNEFILSISPSALSNSRRQSRIDNLRGLKFLKSIGVELAEREVATPAEGRKILNVKKSMINGQ